MSGTPDIIFFSPLPPKPNGIATYLAEQLPYWAQRHRCMVVVEDNHPEPCDIPTSIKVIHLSEYQRQSEDLANAAHIYHVGNNLDARYLIPTLHSRPGIVVLHDFNLHHLVGEMTLGAHAPKAYNDALFQQYGRLGYLLGEQLDSHGLKGVQQTTELDFAGSIVESAQHMIVHSEFTASKLLSFQPDCQVQVIPHHLTPTGDTFKAEFKDDYREILSLPKNKPIFTSLGFIAEAKQISEVLNVCGNLKLAGIDFLYVLAGSAKAKEYDIFWEIESRGLTDYVTVTGYLSEDDFFRHLHAADFIVNLRYPSGGETSGTFVRAMGAGKCCVIIDEGPFVEVPHDCAVKLTWGPDFRTHLHASMVDLLNDTNKTVQKIGENAQQWTVKRQLIHHCVASYELAVSEALGRAPAHLDVSSTKNWFGYLLPSQIETWKSQCQDLWRPMNATQGLHWWNEGLVPLAGHPFDTITVVGGDQRTQDILTSLYCYKSENIVLLPWSKFFDDTCKKGWNSHNNILFLAEARYWVNDPVALLSRINWNCQQGAHVVAGILWQEPLYGDVPISPSILPDLCRAAGLIPQKTVSEVHHASLLDDFDFSNVEEWYVQVEVGSRMLDRFPRPHYAGSYSVAERLHPSYLADKMASQTTRGDFTLDALGPSGQ